IKFSASVEMQSTSYSSATLRPILHNPSIERPTTDLDPAAVFNIDNTVKNYTPELKDVTNIKRLESEMVIIPGGSFVRGSQDGNRDECPRHLVNLSCFAIDTFPVTNEH